ncbi:MAG TPA: hypothetical protein VH277_08770, partial [Gemmatimonadaceae bacterium]|nr:hypothetical protein [Gemmatimonadaceae bacterium]
MRRLAVLMLAAVASTAVPLSAQATHTDFSGKWNLDVSKLDAQMAQAGITSATLTITQDAKTLKQEQSMSSAAMGAGAFTVNYAFDGESKNNVSQGGMSMDMTSTLAWDGPVLVINTKASVQGQDLQRTDRYSLDAAGKVLTIDTNMN